MSKEKLLASAQKNLEKGQIGKAIKDYQKILEADPRDIRNRQKLAELLSRDRMKDEALKEYETVARTYSDTGFYLKAIAVYRQMQRLDPARPEIYLRLAELNEKQGLIGDALAEYRNLSACYEKNRLFSEQLKTLQKMRELEPENLNIRVKIVENSLLVDSAENARKELQALLDELAVANDSARALKLYDHFIPKFPDDLLLLAGQAEVLIRKGEKNRGMQALHDLLRKDPENAGVLRILARVYRQEGKHQEERLIYERLLVRRPDDLEFREAYLRAGIEAGETAIVRRDLDKWQDDFSNAGRNELVQGLLARLNGSGPQAQASVRPAPGSMATEDPEETAAENLLPADEPTAAPERLEPAELAESAETLEDLEEIAELLDEEEPAEKEVAQAAGTDDAEEVSLDFLEEAPLDFLEANVLSPEPEVPAPTEVELELELDMELELDAEPALEVHAEETKVVADPEEEEALLELDLDDDFSAAVDLPAETADAAVETFAETKSATEDFIDLGADIAGELDEPSPHAEHPEIANSGSSAAPKKRIKTDVEVDDPESHYNLGIAYKEMGLLDDAIGEFDKAMFAPSRGVPCLILKGMCLLEKGERKKAEETLRAGLARTDFDEEGRISLQYELGEIYESGNQLKEALDCFQYVADRDLFYRNAGERVAALRQRLGLDNGGAGAGGRKNRVSYV